MVVIQKHLNRPSKLVEALLDLEHAWYAAAFEAGVNCVDFPIHLCSPLCDTALAVAQIYGVESVVVMGLTSPV